MHHRPLVLLLAAGSLAGPVGQAEDVITVSGTPAGLTIHGAVAGDAPLPASDASTTYSISTSSPGRRVTVSLDTPLPAGVTLRMRLAAPPGATSLGAIALSTTPQDVVRDLPAGRHESLTITYTLSVAAAAGVVPPTLGAVTFTLVSGS